jgi:hypothetical protein
MNQRKTGLIKDAIFSHRLQCSQCGGLLQMKDGCQLSELAKSSQSSIRSGDSVTFIEPCVRCIDIAIAPALALKAALKLF